MISAETKATLSVAETMLGKRYSALHNVGATYRHDGPGAVPVDTDSVLDVVTDALSDALETIAKLRARLRAQEASSPVLDASRHRRVRPSLAVDAAEKMARDREAQWQRARSGSAGS